MTWWIRISRRLSQRRERNAIQNNSNKHHQQTSPDDKKLMDCRVIAEPVAPGLDCWLL
jgi:hypothetical protein